MHRVRLSRTIRLAVVNTREGKEGPARSGLAAYVGLATYATTTVRAEAQTAAAVRIKLRSIRVTEDIFGVQLHRSRRGASGRAGID